MLLPGYLVMTFLRMNKVNNKKNYQVPSKCKWFVRKKAYCSFDPIVANSRTVYFKPCSLCSPKVFSCKNFKQKGE